MRTTKQERDMILEMLASGKINVSEACDLFDVIESSVEAETDTDATPLSGDDFADQLKQNTRNEIPHAVNSAKSPYIFSH